MDFYDDYAHHPTEIKFVLEGVKKVYEGYDKVCVFQPHRISRLKDLRREFSFAFKDADTVVLCPIYSAGEKIKLGFNYINFAKEIIKNSKVKLFIVKNEIQLSKFTKKKYAWKKNCNWNGCWFNFKLDEKTSSINKMNIQKLKKNFK